MLGGSQHETILSFFFFLDAAFEEQNRITTTIYKRKETLTKHCKYAKGLTICEAIDLKRVLESNKKMNIPLEYHKRPENILSKKLSELYKQLQELIRYTEANKSCGRKKNLNWNGIAA